MKEVLASLLAGFAADGVSAPVAEMKSGLLYLMIMAVVIANNKIKTIPAAGKAYQVAAADKTNKAVVICSVP